MNIVAYGHKSSFVAIQVTNKLMRRRVLKIGFLKCLAISLLVPLRAVPPGIIIAHSPASSGRYIGSPSLAVLPDGEYVAAHDFFGPGSGQYESGISEIYVSKDRGLTWQLRSVVHGAFQSEIFVHQGTLYLLGIDHLPGSKLPSLAANLLTTVGMTDKNENHIVIRRSLDGGETWTEPKSSASGLLMTGSFGFAPTPVIEAAGRLWRAQDTATLSVPVNAGLLQAANWHFTPGPAYDKKWFNGEFESWGEGSLVEAPDGRIVNLTKVRYLKPGDDHAALIFVDTTGKEAHFDPTTDFVRMPGARLKFTARFDPLSKRYWALTNYLPPIDYGEKTDLRRNTVALVSSADLRNWRLDAVLLHDADVAYHGMQYLDWDFEGDDIIALCRTAWPDGQGGPVRQHDANYLTFHRFAHFRDLTSENSVQIPAK
jgi:hypothetical protein